MRTQLTQARHRRTWVRDACARGLIASTALALLASSATAQTIPFTNFPNTPNQVPQNVRLTVSDVQQVLRQMVVEATAQGMPGTFAVCDRVGNVLAVYEMNNVPINRPDLPIQGLLPAPIQTQMVDPKAPKVPRNQTTSETFTGTMTGIPQLAFDVLNLVGGNALNGLNFANLPATLTSISKCGTAAYLSSNGNAFSTRTASQIIQENFNPGTFLDSGPLFGVQFSQLPCSDFNTRFETNNVDNPGQIEATAGPRRLPLGFSADPGGLPLYKNGTLVGAVGVAADFDYGLDKVVQGKDRLPDELIARAGTRLFPEPVDIRAERINVDGRSLRMSDAETYDLLTTISDGAGLDLNAAGSFVRVPGYTLGGPIEGTAFGFSGSGFIPDPDNIFASTRSGHNQAFVVATSDDVNRFPPIASATTPDGLTADEVRILLDSAFEVLSRTRGLIRRPLGSNATVTVTVSDVDGTILGVVRDADALVFGTDVSVQKARSTAFMSGSLNEGLLRGANFGDLVDATNAFLGVTGFNGGFAFSERALGNIGRPLYPDGTPNTPNGPLSLPIETWSPFNTGMQLDLIIADVLQHVAFTLGLDDDLGVTDVEASCTAFEGVNLGDGLQIFSGGHPVYRGNQLIGGVGISGDGIDQDGMIAFLGIGQAEQFLDAGNGRPAGQNPGNPPPSIRAGQLSPRGITIRYEQCPYAPFVQSNDQNVCDGL